jgi:demethylsterigmatocystin 6-O-methyltransferase
MQIMPTYLANIGYRNPDSHVSQTPARHAFGCEFWEHLSKHPEKQADFDSSMKMSDMVPPATLPTYPFAAKASELRHDQVAIVDIGGGHGQFLERLRNQSPDLPGRFVLQDLQQSIDLLKGSEGDLCFVAMAHDMFAPQPIIGKPS